MTEVFFYEAFAEEAHELRAHLPAGVQAGFTDRTIQEHGAAEPPAGLISIRTQSRIPPAWAGRLRGILTRSTGYDHVRDYLALTGARLPCGYLPLYCARAVAEQAMLLWMALGRKLPQQTAQFATFHRDGITGAECQGKNLAVFGVGHIGLETTRVGRGLDMQVLGVDLEPRHPEVAYASPAEALARADVIVCAMNLTAENPDYFDLARWRQVKPGALFVNIARGELAPARDLLRALDEGLLGGIGLDVYNHENVLAVALRGGTRPDDPEVDATLELARRPQVILTPHNAFNTRESVARKSRQSCEQVDAFLRTGRFLWPMPE